MSSIAVRGATSPPVTRRHSCGCNDIARMPLASELTVASWPASSSTIAVEVISASLSVSPWSSTATSSLISVPSGARRLSEISARV